MVFQLQFAQIKSPDLQSWFMWSAAAAAGVCQRELFPCLQPKLSFDLILVHVTMKVFAAVLSKKGVAGWGKRTICLPIAEGGRMVRGYNLSESWRELVWAQPSSPGPLCFSFSIPELGPSPRFTLQSWPSCRVTGILEVGVFFATAGRKMAFLASETWSEPYSNQRITYQ